LEEILAQKHKEHTDSSQYVKNPGQDSQEYKKEVDRKEKERIERMKKALEHNPREKLAVSVENWTKNQSTISTLKVYWTHLGNLSKRIPNWQIIS